MAGIRTARRAAHHLRPAHESTSALRTVMADAASSANDPDDGSGTLANAAARSRSNPPARPGLGAAGTTGCSFAQHHQVVEVDDFVVVEVALVHVGWPLVL